jgi:deoxyribonuclease V
LREAFRQIAGPIDLLLVDGQGYAHPRRFGLACHLGLLLDVPAIGCAKSRLIGEHREPDTGAGSSAPLTDSGEVVGTVLRTRDGIRPLYVSPGHEIGLDEAQAWVLRCCRGYRLPEPTRLADQAAGGRQLLLAACS